MGNNTENKKRIDQKFLYEKLTGEAILTSKQNSNIKKLSRPFKQKNQQKSILSNN